MVRTALVTGASTGIGYELCKLFARDHHALVLVARDKTRLDAVAKELTSHHDISFRVLPADLSDQQAPTKIYEVLQKESINIDFLVNNAGFGLGGSFSKTDLNVELEMIQVNISSLVSLTKLFMKPMLARNYGKILNVASTAAFLPGPLMSIYYATKAFVLSFSEALENELKGTGITVTALCPGPTQTEFQARARIQGTRLFRSKLIASMSADKVALIGYRKFMRGNRLVIPGLLNKITVQSLRLSPRSAVVQISRKLQES